MKAYRKGAVREKGTVEVVLIYGYEERRQDKRRIDFLGVGSEVGQWLERRSVRQGAHRARGD
jgi:hypothetical protein